MNSYDIDQYFIRPIGTFAWILAAVYLSRIAVGVHKKIFITITGMVVLCDVVIQLIDLNIFVAEDSHRQMIYFAWGILAICNSVLIVLIIRSLMKRLKIALNK